VARATLAEKLLARLDAKIAALRLAREELLAEIEAIKTNKATDDPSSTGE
jgi:hypothetical protein